MKEMTVVQTEFLKILESFMHNKAYELPDGFSDFQELFQTAVTHNVAALVYEQIRGNRICSQPKHAQMMTAWKRNAVREVMMQIQRTDGFLTIYETLCENGVRPLIMKGLICRNLYSKSDYRISSDEDILIMSEDASFCDDIFARNGFQKTSDQPNETAYINPRNGTYIEMHKALFSESSDAYGHLNEEFAQVFDHCVCEEIQGKQIWTLCPTEHLFYLICHSFKHFLHSGFGMRQLCDMVMMAERYGQQIDWTYIDERLARLHMDVYWDGLVEIGIRYLGFDQESACYPKEMRDAQVDYMPLLLDLMDSGIFGDSNMERKHSSNMTLKAAAGGKANTAQSLGASLFPKAEYMKQTFSWLKKYPWLLPAAYAIRIVRYLKRRKDTPEDGRNSVQIGVERVELLRKYRIIQ